MLAFPKSPRWRSPKLLKSMEGEACTLLIPGYCTGDRSTVVPCHSPFRRHGKAQSMKAHDYYAVPGCFRCHSVLDRREPSKFSREDLDAFFMAAFERTIAELFKEGVIRVHERLEDDAPF